MIVLDKVFRQKDSHFLRLLNELRRGIVSKATNEILNKKVSENNQKLARASRKKMDRHIHTHIHTHTRTYITPHTCAPILNSKRAGALIPATNWRKYCSIPASTAL